MSMRRSCVLDKRKTHRGLVDRLPQTFQPRRQDYHSFTSTKGFSLLANHNTSRHFSLPIINRIMQRSRRDMLTGKESAFAIKEGWLTKQGNYIKNWRPRWFQLKDGILLYYKEPTMELKPTNYFVLAGSTISPFEKVGPGCFEMIMANGERRYMQAESRVERDEWIKHLSEAAIKRPLSILRELNSSSPSADSQISVPGSKRTITKLTPEHFNFLKVLGKGNYGKVMLAVLKDGDGRYFAVKIIKKSSLIDEESLEHVLAENRVLQTLDHPFLVKLYCSFQTDDRLYFVMEYVNGGELFFHIGREKRFGEDRVRFYASQIVLALHYLHQKGIVYRDLKLENLLLDEAGNIKITDFGLVKEGVGAYDVTSTFCGTPEYLAPEILEEENYGISVDWWALGVVMYELMVGRPPFGPTNNMEKLFHNIIHQTIMFPPSLSNEARSILEALLERDCTKRLGSSQADGDEVKQHQFFSTIDWDRLIKKELPAPFVPQINAPADVRNFDQEFTDLPPILTPTGNSAPVAAVLNEGFSFLDPSMLPPSRRPSAADEN
eukprot:Partr_v1_DN27497_c1_g1_i1_m72422 putative AGC family protein kinase